MTINEGTHSCFLYTVPQWSSVLFFSRFFLAKLNNLILNLQNVTERQTIFWLSYFFWSAGWSLQSDLTCPQLSRSPTSNRGSNKFSKQPTCQRWGQTWDCGNWRHCCFTSPRTVMSRCFQSRSSCAAVVAGQRWVIFRTGWGVSAT